MKHGAQLNHKQQLLDRYGNLFYNILHTKSRKKYVKFLPNDQPLNQERSPKPVQGSGKEEY